MVRGLGSSRHVGAGFVALALLVTGCGGSSDAQSSSSAAAPSTGTGNTQILLDSQELDVLGRPITYPKKTKAAQISSSLVTLEPGQESGWHKHKVPLFVYVMEGTLSVEYDAGVIKEYPAGSALMEAKGVWQNATNKGDQPVRVLEVSMGAQGVKNTVTRAG